jgi:hypothetical protein
VQLLRRRLVDLHVRAGVDGGKIAGLGVYSVCFRVLRHVAVRAHPLKIGLCVRTALF